MLFHLFSPIFFFSSGGKCSGTWDLVEEQSFGSYARLCFGGDNAVCPDVCRRRKQGFSQKRGWGMVVGNPWPAAPDQGVFGIGVVSGQGCVYIAIICAHTALGGGWELSGVSPEKNWCSFLHFRNRWQIRFYWGAFVGSKQQGGTAKKEIQKRLFDCYLGGCLGGSGFWDG